MWATSDRSDGRHRQRQTDFGDGGCNSMRKGTQDGLGVGVLRFLILELKNKRNPDRVYQVAIPVLHMDHPKFGSLHAGSHLFW